MADIGTLPRVGNQNFARERGSGMKQSGEVLGGVADVSLRKVDDSVKPFERVIDDDVAAPEVAMDERLGRPLANPLDTSRVLPISGKCRVKLASQIE